jgi:hypothetical protein
MKKYRTIQTSAVFREVNEQGPQTILIVRGLLRPFEQYMKRCDEDNEVISFSLL